MPASATQRLWTHGTVTRQSTPPRPSLAGLSVPSSLQLERDCSRQAFVRVAPIRPYDALRISALPLPAAARARQCCCRHCCCAPATDRQAQLASAQRFRGAPRRRGGADSSPRAARARRRSAILLRVFAPAASAGLGGASSGARAPALLGGALGARSGAFAWERARGGGADGTAAAGARASERGFFFRRGAAFASDGDRDFDASLRARDPAIGYKSVETVTDIAEQAGITVIARDDMPANNLLLTFAKAQAQATS